MEVKRMNIKNQIKAHIMFAGFTMAEVLGYEIVWQKRKDNG